MSEERKEFFMDAKPQISVFVAESGNLQVNVSQMDDQAEKIIHGSIEIPFDCAEAVAEAILRIVRE